MYVYIKESVKLTNVYTLENSQNDHLQIIVLNATQGYTPIRKFIDCLINNKILNYTYVCTL